MTHATHAQIVELLGDVDELYVKRIEDTGASLDEIGEALGDLEDEDRLGEPPRMAWSPKVAEIRAILEELLDESDDELDRGYREV
jgi:DNA-binding transcriptional MerR regulator